MTSAILSRRRIFTSAGLLPQQQTITFRAPVRRLEFQTDTSSRLPFARYMWNHTFRGMP